MRLVASLALLTRLVIANPTIKLPINSQVPPVAHAQEAFGFVFSDSTFTSNSNISYSLTGSPSWLRLESPSRSLVGTPDSDDVGSRDVTLVATDSNGSTSMSFTLIVTDGTRPRVGLSIESQLPAYGAYSSPNRILFAPSSPLLISFSPSTFIDTSPTTAYYATTSDNTPLPSWINFVPSSLSFSGTTPAATSVLDKTQVFGIRLSASDIIGFSDVSIDFEIVVENHLLAFRSSSLVVYVAPDVSLNDGTIGKNLQLDERQIRPLDIERCIADTPSWLSLNPKTLELSGTAPSDFQGQNFTVTVTDLYGDSASVVVMLQSTNSLAGGLLNPIGTVNATLGTEFEYKLGPTLNASMAALSVDLGSATGWLAYDNVTKQIHGKVPIDLRPQQVILNITASLGDETQSEILTIAVISSESTGSDTNPQSPIFSNPHAAANSGTGAKPWIAAIIVPVVLAIAGLIFYLLCARRRRRVHCRGRFNLASDNSSRSSRISASPPTLSEKRDWRRASYEEDGLSEAMRKLGGHNLTAHLPEFVRRPSRHRQQPKHLSNPPRLDSPASSWCLPALTSVLSSSRPFSLAPSNFDPITEESATVKEKQKTDHTLPPPVATTAKGRSSTRRRSSQFLETFSRRGLGHGKPDWTRTDLNGGHDKSLRLGARPSSSGPFGFGIVQRSWRHPEQPDSSDDWTTVSSAKHEGGRVRRATIRPVSQRSTSSWSDPSTPLQRPRFSRNRHSNRLFASGSSLHDRRIRITRSRSSSLGHGLRPHSRSQPPSISEYPKVIDVREGWNRLRKQSSLSSNDPRFRSAVPSDGGSVIFEFQDDLASPETRPGLSVLEHRRSSPLAELAERFQFSEPASDDKSAVLGDEETKRSSRSGKSEEVRWMSRGERLGRRIGMGQTDPMNRSMRGRVETVGSYSTGKAGSKRSESDTST